VKKIKAKNRIKGFKISCHEASTIFYQNLSITAKVCIFLAAAEALLKCVSKHIFLMPCLNRFRSIFQKKFIFYATLWRYFEGEFFLTSKIQ
jgi:hypothetical protein